MLFPCLVSGLFLRLILVLFPGMIPVCLGMNFSRFVPRFRRVFRRWRGVFGSGLRRTGRGGLATGQPGTNLQNDIVVEGAGVGFLIMNTQFRQQIENHVRFYLEFARQLINANLTHNGMPS
jgi:hypothetical protein